MGQSPDVLVIGGGIIGLTSAYYLAKAGLSVEVIDKGDLGREASWAGAGIIPPGNPDRAATPIDMLRGIGSQRFPAFSAELRDATGIDNGYVRCGGIEFLHEGDESVLELWRAEQITFKAAGRTELLEAEPGLQPPAGLSGYLLPDCGQVRNPWHLRALSEACRSLGVRLVTHSPIAMLIPDRSGEVSAAFTADQEFKQAGCYLITAGAWTDKLTRNNFGVRLGVGPVRGQVLLFRPTRSVLTRVVMVGKRYLVPRTDGRTLAGSTEEPGAGFEKANTPEAVQELTDFAYGLVPALRRADVEKTWAGLRPGSPDGMPFIGRVPGWDNVFVAAGHFRAGIQLSIGTAELVADLILGRSPAVPPAAFRLDREPDLTATPAFRS